MNKNTYKLICSDIDGTLLNKDRCLSINTIKTFQQLESHNIPIILASARMPKSIRAILAEANLNQIVVAYNGALIEDKIDENGETQELLNVKIPLAVAEEISLLCQTADIHCSLQHKNDWFANRMDFWTEREINNTRQKPHIASYNHIFKIAPHIQGFHKIMCMGEEATIEELYTFLSEVFAQKVAIYRSKNTYIEISPLETNKFVALSFLCNQLNISLKEVLSFGDNYNDLEMIAHSGMGIAVENAVEELKKVAKEITAKNTEDGVAKAIAKYWAQT